MTSQTSQVLQNHLQAAARNVDAVMRDYSDQSVLVTGDRTYRGLSEIRAFFSQLLEGPTGGFLKTMKMHRQEIVGDVGYILWEAKPWFAFATDTFVVRDGKILYQTFASTSVAV